MDPVRRVPRRLLTPRPAYPWSLTWFLLLERDIGDVRVRALGRSGDASPSERKDSPPGGSSAGCDNVCHRRGRHLTMAVSGAPAAPVPSREEQDVTTVRDA